MPTDGRGKEKGFLLELLNVVFAEVEVGGGMVVKGEDVVGGFQFGDSDEAWVARGGECGEAGQDAGEIGGELGCSGGIDAHFCCMR